MRICKEKWSGAELGRYAMPAMQLNRSNSRMALKVILKQAENTQNILGPKRGIDEQSAIFRKWLAHEPSTEQQTRGQGGRKHSNQSLVSYERDANGLITVASNHIAVVEKMAEARLIMAFDECVPCLRIRPVVNHNDRHHISPIQFDSPRPVSMKSATGAWETALASRQNVHL